MLNTNILFWLSISYQKPFVISVSVIYSQIINLKLNLRPKIEHVKLFKTYIQNTTLSNFYLFIFFFWHIAAIFTVWKNENILFYLFIFIYLFCFYLFIYLFIFFHFMIFFG